MSTINQLSATDALSGGDLLVVYSQANGDARKTSLTTFQSWLESQNLSLTDGKVTQYNAPLTGATLQVTDSSVSTWLVLTPAGTIAALTVKLPLVTNAIGGQEVLINTTQTITALTFNANGGAIIGAPSTLAANGYLTLRFDDVMDTWYRVG